MARKTANGAKLRRTFPLVPVKKELAVKEISSEDQDHDEFKITSVEFDSLWLAVVQLNKKVAEQRVIIDRQRQQLHALALELQTVKECEKRGGLWEGFSGPVNQ